MQIETVRNVHCNKDLSNLLSLNPNLTMQLFVTGETYEEIATMQKSHMTKLQTYGQILSYIGKINHIFLPNCSESQLDKCNCLYW